MSSELPLNSHERATGQPTWTVGETAEVYQRGAVGREERITQATEQLLDLAGVGPGNCVLDVAAGPGGQTFQAARRAGPSGSVLATDISAAMLEALADGAREIGLTNVETRMMDAERLDLSNESFDVVICRDGLMLLPDPAKALAEMCRVTRRGDRVAALVFSEEQRNPYFSIPQGIARRIGGLPEPLPGVPGPCSLGDPQRLGDLFRAAGLHDIEMHRALTVQRFTSATKALSSIQEGSVHTRELMLQLTEAQRDQAWHEVERALRRLEGPNGCELPGESLIVVGVK